MAWNTVSSVILGSYQYPREYERATSGFYPADWYNIRILAHDGWYPEWYTTWSMRDKNAPTWSGRDKHIVAWSE